MKEVKVFIDYVEGRGYSAVIFKAEYSCVFSPLSRTLYI